ncbi:SHOCT domain-containing protein [Ideonella margarita]|uniref:SHOCT domain-containing protein n=1 Tax=Ideonella margarita TaxID=2984191 RepID=A0ABU9C6K4_9BURK
MISMIWKWTCRGGAVLVGAFGLLLFAKLIFAKHFDVLAMVVVPFVGVFFLALAYKIWPKQTPLEQRNHRQAKLGKLADMITSPMTELTELAGGIAASAIESAKEIASSAIVQRFKNAGKAASREMAEQREARYNAQQSLERERLRIEALHAKFIDQIKEIATSPLILAKVFSAGELAMKRDEPVYVTQTTNGVCIAVMDARKRFDIPWDDLLGIEATGTGKSTRNAGIVGGGLGVEGAATGILVASALNAISTRTSLDSWLTLRTATNEVVFSVLQSDPREVRGMLARAFAVVGAKSVAKPEGTNGLAAELSVLSKLHADGALTEAEFNSAKAKLLAK